MQSFCDQLRNGGEDTAHFCGLCSRTSQQGKRGPYTSSVFMDGANPRHIFLMADNALHASSNMRPTLPFACIWLIPKHADESCRRLPSVAHRPLLLGIGGLRLATISWELSGKGTDLRTRTLMSSWRMKSGMSYHNHCWTALLCTCVPRCTNLPRHCRGYERLFASFVRR